MSISIQQISYIHPDKEVLFSDLNFAISKGQKLGLVGNNGCGKSTLLQIIAGQLSPSSGVIVRLDDLYYIPQHFGQYDSLTIAQALQIERKQQALHAILSGDASNENFVILDDDWNIEERSIAALDLWGLGQFTLSYPMNLLSGGEKTRVFLAGMDIHHPSVVLMDEPTNHLDSSGRQRLYDWVEKYRSTLLVVSHDRTLLNLLPEICELEKHQINYYGGNYEFYKEQKTLMQEALQQRVDDTLTYTALSTMAFNNQPYKIYSDLDSGFDKANMYKEVFGGYVLPASSTGSASSSTGSGTGTSGH